MSNESAPLPVSTTLHRSAGELRLLLHRLELVEHHLEKLFSASSDVLGTEAIGALQEIDLIAQSTEAVADFISLVAEKPGVQEVDICIGDGLQAMKLRDLATRLAGKELTREAVSTPELF